MISIVNDEQFLPIKALKAADVEVTYEHGRFRYIRFQGREVIRMIYPALRDENWNTVPYTISNEVVTTSRQEVSIRFTAEFKAGDIQYEAAFQLGIADSGRVTYSMQGKSATVFKSKRIGICVHHPIPSCMGRQVEIVHDNGTSEHTIFPVLISPDRPFTDVSQMRWTSADDLRCELLFEGDVFETEDQRNWTDDSYKTYSGPQYRVPMLHIAKGDTMHQQVTLQITGNVSPLAQTEEKTSTKKPLPEIGYLISDEPASYTDEITTLANQIPLDHLLVNVTLNDKGWRAVFERAAELATRLGTMLKLQVYFSSFSQQEIDAVKKLLSQYTKQVKDVLILSADKATPPLNEFSKAYAILKKEWPQLTVGYGSSSWFAALHSSLPIGIPCDFVSFTISPQAHQTDHRSILENLLSQYATIETIHSRMGKVPVHVLLQFSKETDKRLHTHFAAWWTLAAIANFSDAASLTVYGLAGGKGVIRLNEPKSSPLYQLLRDIKMFGPDHLTVEHPSFASNPIEKLRSSVVCCGKEDGLKTCYSITDI